MHSIRIDREKHLAHEPQTGHNRFHPGIAPALEAPRGEQKNRIKEDNMPSDQIL